MTVRSTLGKWGQAAWVMENRPPSADLHPLGHGWYSWVEQGPLLF